jgi:hypothetical protein
MTMRHQARVRVELERAMTPEDQRLISSGKGVPRADLPQVGVVDQETEDAQEDRRRRSSQVRDLRLAR